MKEPATRIRSLTKTYRVPVREAGLRATLRSLVQRETRAVDAVRAIDSDVAPGEVAGGASPLPLVWH